LIGGAEMVNKMRQGSQTETVKTGTPTDDMGQFVSAVLAANESGWSAVLPQQKGIDYAKPVLVLYSGRTVSGCGDAQALCSPTNPRPDFNLP
jgi:uncharacterized protein